MKKEKLGFHIVLLGQIASGKDTQAKMLMQKYLLRPVESGKYWRKLEKEKSPKGELLRKTTGKGRPAPVSLMKEFLLNEISKKPKNSDLVFVGNPRLKPEAQLLKKIMLSRKESFIALYITLPEKEIHHRSSARMRNADDQKYIKNRIAWHKDQVGKTVNYFDSLGVLKKINGNQTIAKVHQDIEKHIEKILKNKKSPK
jgi:adenylate kinase